MTAMNLINNWMVGSELVLLKCHRVLAECGWREPFLNPAPHTEKFIHQALALLQSSNVHLPPAFTQSQETCQLWRSLGAIITGNFDSYSFRTSALPPLNIQDPSAFRLPTHGLRNPQ
jgi:hypothetical protein